MSIKTEVAVQNLIAEVEALRRRVEALEAKRPVGRPPNEAKAA